jgi:hypothetical protein
MRVGCGRLDGCVPASTGADANRRPAARKRELPRNVWRMAHMLNYRTEIT